MKLITDEQREQLLRNGANPDADHHPVVRLFDPAGPATWLIAWLDPADPDIGHGLADLGFGCPELGTIHVSEIEMYEGRFGIAIQRDLYFRPSQPISVYAEAARHSSGITLSQDVLDIFAFRLKSRVP